MLTIFDFAVSGCRFEFNSITGPNARFTVEYSPSLKMWFVFKEDMTEDCLFKLKLDKPPKKNSITIEAAENVLQDYLNSI